MIGHTLNDHWFDYSVRDRTPFLCLYVYIPCEFVQICLYSLHVLFDDSDMLNIEQAKPIKYV